MFKNIIKIFTGTFVSRIFGFLREMVIASFFGTGSIADAFTLAILFPNIFRQILGEDMVERAFMPPFKTMYDTGEKKQSWKFISIVFNWFFFLLLGGMLLLYFVVPLFFSVRDSFPLLSQWIFPSTNFDYDLSLNLILILLPFMVFIGLAAFVGSMLNFFERNWIFGFAPVMLSIGVIGSVYILYPYIEGYSIAVGYVVGAFLQFLIQIPFLVNRKFRKETGIKYHKKLKDKVLDFKIIKRESKIITLNAIFNKSSEVFGRFLAAALASGATSSLFYALRLLQLPFAIISLSIARGINPALNKLKSTNDYIGFNKAYNRGLKLYYIIYFPLLAFLLISSKELVYIVFFRGSFNQASLMLTSSAFNMYVLGLIPMSLLAYYIRILSLFNKNRYALKVSIISALTNIIAAIVLVKFTALNHEAIALASSIAFFINMILMSRYLKKELKNYVKKDKKIKKNNIFMALLLFAIVAIYMTYSLDFYDSKLLAIISLIIKFSVIYSIYSVLFFIIKDTRTIAMSVIKKIVSIRKR